MFRTKLGTFFHDDTFPLQSFLTHPGIKLDYIFPLFCPTSSQNNIECNMLIAGVNIWLRMTEVMSDLDFIELGGCSVYQRLDASYGNLANQLAGYVASVLTLHIYSIIQKVM